MPLFRPTPSPRAPAGFTLLEMCIVLFVIALLAGLSVPALHSALVEQRLRSDEAQTASLVREGMLDANEEGHAYTLTLADRTLTLTSDGPGAPGENSDPAPEVRLTHPLERATADGDGRWNPCSSAAWTFTTHELCPVPRVRFQEQGDYLETSFNALTGDAENEAMSLP